MSKTDKPRPYSGLSADQILGLLADSPAQKRDALAQLLLYHTHERPLERAEQQKLFLGIVAQDALPLNDKLNARAAAAHKSLELCDKDAVLGLLPILAQSVEEAQTLPWAGSIRHNRIHVGFSLAYVYLQACLYADAARFDQAALRVRALITDLPTKHLGRGFFRTAANVSKCLGLIAARRLRAGDLEGAAAIGTDIRRALMLAIEVRSLHTSIWPISRSLPKTRLARNTPLGAVDISNEMRENARANHIAQMVQTAAEGDRHAAARSSLITELVTVSVSNAYPGERDHLVTRFNGLFPDALVQAQDDAI